VLEPGPVAARRPRPGRARRHLRLAGPDAGDPATRLPRARGHPGDAPPSVVELEASGRFGPVRRHEYPWHERYPADRYLELLTTQSDHRMLPEPERRALLDGVAAVVADAGGEIRVDYVAELYLARRA
jgi:hypothetical protein